MEEEGGKGRIYRGREGGKVGQGQVGSAHRINLLIFLLKVNINMDVDGKEEMDERLLLTQATASGRRFQDSRCKETSKFFFTSHDR